MSAPSLLLALHSSSESLGVGLCDLQAPEAPPQCASFPLGRQLSNDLLPCVEQLLPAERWPQLARIVVATGPGGFTGTRLTVVLARTLAQQLQIPLHGFGSFLLGGRLRKKDQEAWEKIWEEEQLSEVQERVRRTRQLQMRARLLLEDGRQLFEKMKKSAFSRLPTKQQWNRIKRENPQSLIRNLCRRKNRGRGS